MGIYKTHIKTVATDEKQVEKKQTQKKQAPILKKNERLVVFKNNYIIFECNQNASI